MKLEKLKMAITYHPHDIGLVSEFLSHVESLGREHGIEIWSEPKAGDDINSAVARAIEGAHLIVVMLSSDYIADDNMITFMKTAFRRHKAKESVTFPVLLRDCLWEYHLKGGDMRILPQNMLSVMKHNDHDDAWKGIILAIGYCVEVLKWQLEAFQLRHENRELKRVINNIKKQ